MKFKKPPPLNIIKISLNKNFFSLCNNPPLENIILWIKIINVFSTVGFFHPAFLSQIYINWKKTYFINVLKFMLHEFQKIIVQEFSNINVPRFLNIHDPSSFIRILFTSNKKKFNVFSTLGKFHKFDKSTTQNLSSIN